MKQTMTFDVCIGNPAFNIAQKGNIAGTGGNTTLYRTMARNDFRRLNAGGHLVYVTLKGIIKDLTDGFFAAYNTLEINLMDDVDYWDFDTCYFLVEHNSKTQVPSLTGGICANIFALDPKDRFPFVYYSGSNNGMSKHFGSGNRVIRRLPGRNNDQPIYDLTPKEIPAGPKFAFNVLESRKSYFVTDEPIYGGTICYIPCNSIEEADRLKLFVERNRAFEEYVKRMKLRGHAFGLRNVRKFDLAQIKTGREFPKEWKLPVSLPDVQQHTKSIDIDHQRKKQTGEVFTNQPIVNAMMDRLAVYRPTAFTSAATTFLDSMCGNGQFLVEVMNRKIAEGISHEQALSTIYGVELMEDNVQICRDRLLCGQEHLRHIVENNIVCADALEYDYSFDGSWEQKRKEVEPVKDLFSGL